MEQVKQAGKAMPKSPSLKVQELTEALQQPSVEQICPTRTIKSINFYRRDLAGSLQQHLQVVDSLEGILSVTLFWEFRTQYIFMSPLICWKSKIYSNKILRMVLGPGLNTEA